MYPAKVAAAKETSTRRGVTARQESPCLTAGEDVKIVFWTIAEDCQEKAERSHYSCLSPSPQE